MFPLPFHHRFYWTSRGHRCRPCPSPPCTCLHLYRAWDPAFSLRVGFHRVLLTHALAPFTTPVCYTYYVFIPGTSGQAGKYVSSAGPQSRRGASLCSKCFDSVEQDSLPTDICFFYLALQVTRPRNLMPPSCDPLDNSSEEGTAIAASKSTWLNYGQALLLRYVGAPLVCIQEKKT